MPQVQQRSEPSPGAGEDSQSFVSELAHRAAGLGREVADIAGVIDDVEATQGR